MNTRSCKKKKMYPSYNLAKQYMAVYYAISKTNTEPYNCKVCGYWHLTKVTK